MNLRKEQTYVHPKIKVVNIEVDQAIMQASQRNIEDLGEWLDEKGWD